MRWAVAERVVGVQEHRLLELDGLGIHHVLDEPKAVGDELAAGLEVAHEELVALLGDLRGGGDIDHKGDLPLLGHLRDGQRMAGIEGARQDVAAFVDGALGLGAGDVGVGFRVDVDDLDAIAELGEEFGRCERAAMHGLAGLGEEARARQQRADLEGLGLRLHHGGAAKAGGGAGHDGAAGQAGRTGHEILPAPGGASRARHPSESRGEGKAGATHGPSPLGCTLRDGCQAGVFCSKRQMSAMMQGGQSGFAALQT